MNSSQKEFKLWDRTTQEVILEACDYCDGQGFLQTAEPSTENCLFIRQLVRCEECLGSGFLEENSK